MDKYCGEDYLSKHHYIASRSIPQVKLTSGTIATNKACVWIDGCNAAIFNYSPPDTS